MSRADINPKETGGRNSIPVDRWVVAAGTPIGIKAGEPCKQNATSSEVTRLLEDADLTIATDQPMTGIAAADSSETASASGYSDQYVPLADIKWEIKTKTSAETNTQAKIDALKGELTLIDLTSSVFTIDTTGTAATAAFLIVGGDPDRSTVHFRIRPDACSYGRAAV